MTADTRDLAGYAALLEALPAPAAHRTRAAMAREGTPYHGPEHLGRMWRLHREVHGEAGRPLVPLLIAYHDIVYEPAAPAGRNEAASVEAFLRDREACGLDEGQVRQITEAILASADHLGEGIRLRPEDNEWGAWFLDLDLEPLASAHFDRNTERLRVEYAHVPPALFDQGRRAFLERLGTAPYLFRTQAARDLGWEEKARDNLARVLGR
nr:hypothetical protein [uncultured Roseococcus sp.]